MVNSQVTTVTLTADTPQEIRFSAAYPYIWVDNKSASDVYASVNGTPEADKDGTYTIAAGSQMVLTTAALRCLAMARCRSLHRLLQAALLSRLREEVIPKSMAFHP